MVQDNPTRTLLLGGLLAVVAVACNDGPAATPTPVESACEAAFRVRNELAGGVLSFLTEAREADIAARVLPGGFGGMWQSPTLNQLVVVLQDLAKRNEAGPMLREILRCNAVYPGWADSLVTPELMVFQQGQYTATQLLRWFGDLSDTREDPRVWASTIDQRLNRIWIAVETAPAVQDLSARVAGSGVPLAAVVFEPPPPNEGRQAYDILNSPVSVRAQEGLLVFTMMVRYTNLAPEPRYLIYCSFPGVPPAQWWTRHIVEKWIGDQWVLAFGQACEDIARPPISVDPDGQYAEEITAAAAVRLRTSPRWWVGRVAGWYRVVGSVFRERLAEPPFVAGTAPLAERTSRPFRLIEGLP